MPLYVEEASAQAVAPILQEAQRLPSAILAIYGRDLYSFERNLTALMFAYKQTAAMQKHRAPFAVHFVVR
jgi:hypothetical protein